ncbi:hypothetical protein BU23DRAFT_565553 [Bimuria novae-zelandiae CBS 107.79]|uniref:Uncharacterized protein n=1 Tax=Bimuria novae-zelandiae CBS 107.79 TaxID=1447943 RepID=A0A6A5VIS1_9PLEO|nr:hypothetical protein BU23DRAFT_565553 [Bimuria novae-zelandiae CBS 107.79]
MHHLYANPAKDWKSEGDLERQFWYDYIIRSGLAESLKDYRSMMLFDLRTIPNALKDPRYQPDNRSAQNTSSEKIIEVYSDAGGSEASRRIRFADLPRLPAELQGLIFNVGNLNQTDVRNISLAIKDFSDVAKEHMCDSVTLHPHNILIFTLKMLNNPELRPKARTLDIENRYYGDITPTDWKDLLFCIKEARKLGLYLLYLSSDAFDLRANPPKESWYSHWAGVLITILLCILPNIHRLRIPNDVFGSLRGHRPCHLDTVFTQPQPQLRRLETLLVCGDDHKVEKLAPLFELPALTTIVAMSFVENGGLSLDMNVFGPACSSNVTTLQLYRGELHNDVATLLARLLKVLIDFSYDNRRF